VPLDSQSIANQVSIEPTRQCPSTVKATSLANSFHTQTQKVFAHDEKVKEHERAIAAVNTSVNLAIKAHENLNLTQENRFLQRQVGE